MENFKEIVEKCAAGELYGTIILNDGREFYSKYLSQYIFNGQIVEDFYTIGLAKYLFHVEQIINFIPNNMQEQIKIDVPEGKVPVMKQTENEVVITWKEKEYSYNDIVEILQKDLHNNYIENLLSLGGFVTTMSSDSSDTTIFYKKVAVLRKLINIRNYFGKCDKTKNGYHICKDTNCYDYSYKFIVREFCICDPHEVVFAKREHAEQAIKMLGDELKYLFEPW